MAPSKTGTSETWPAFPKTDHAAVRLRCTPPLIWNPWSGPLPGISERPDPGAARVKWSVKVQEFLAHPAIPQKLPAAVERSPSTYAPIQSIVFVLS